MSRSEELAITVCLVHLDVARDSATGTQLDDLNRRISDALGVELRDYTRSVDDALTLVPDGWGGDIAWENTLQSASVVLSAANPNNPETSDKLVSYALRDGARVHAPLPIAICVAALNVHSLIRKRTSRSPSISD
jgi:hypothetical protein